MKMNHSLFFRPIFLLGLILLLVNDFYLKYAFPCMFTGKLSDFAGLFIFPYFFSVFFEKRTKIIYVTTALFFMYWKLEMAQPLIDLLAKVTQLPLYRTVDATDLIALLILPVSYQYFKRELYVPVKANLIVNMLVITMSCFSFVATTLQKAVSELNLLSGKGFVIPISEYDYLNQFKEPNKRPIGYDHFYIAELDIKVYVETEVKAFDKKNALITLKTITETVAEGGIFSAPAEEGVKAVTELTVEDYEKYYGAYLAEEFGSVKILPTQ